MKLELPTKATMVDDAIRIVSDHSNFKELSHDYVINKLNEGQYDYIS
jgi:hypothetical protein